MAGMSYTAIGSFIYFLRALLLYNNEKNPRNFLVFSPPTVPMWQIFRLLVSVLSQSDKTRYRVTKHDIGLYYAECRQTTCLYGILGVLYFGFDACAL